MSVLDPDVSYIEFDGKQYKGDSAGALLDRLTEDEQARAWVVLENGFRTSLSKFLGASDAPRVDSDGKVRF